MNHSYELLTDLFSDPFSDEFGDDDCSPFPECQGAPSETDDSVAGLPAMDWGMRGLVVPLRRAKGYSVSRLF
ncbi:hypothetical protein [Methylotetracoccus oryzae]|uniref:hypothetical protein n=1 Tax=Methylotetracoccus oryzae TaxID=1919059 RepID=UPI00111B580D|nr:hypothetical protein [Methylotetracoccus oryzae]